MQFNTLTLTLQNFLMAFSAGYGRIQGAANSLLGILVGIEVVLLGLWTALGGGDNVVGIFKKILHIGLWVWIVQSFPTLAKAFVQSLVQAGLVAGGGSGDVSLMMDPSRIAGYGLDATAPLTQKLADLGMTDLSDLVVFALGYLVILACFLVMAMNVFLAVLEYYLFAALVGILLPFGLLSPTKFLAEKAIGAVVSAGVKLMTLSFLTAAVDPVLHNIHFAGPEITLNELWSVFLTVCALMLLCWKAPSLASSLLAGSPHLGAGDVAQATQGPMAAGQAVGALAMGNVAEAGRAALKAARNSRRRGAWTGGTARHVRRCRLRGRRRGVERRFGAWRRRGRIAGGRRGARRVRAAGRERHPRFEFDGPDRTSGAAHDRRRLKGPIPMSAPLKWSPDGHADTPYRRARQEWDTRMGTALVHAHHWRLATFASLGAVTLALGGMIYLGAQPKAVPHIIEVDRLGAATYLGPVGRPGDSYVPSDAVITYHLRRFVDDTRSLCSDPTVLKRNWLEAYALLTPRGGNMLTAFVDKPENDPFRRAQDERVTLEFQSAVRVSADTWQLDWQETAWDKNGSPLGSPTSWRAMLRTLLQVPKTPEALRKNPIGLYIDEFHWNQVGG